NLGTEGRQQFFDGVYDLDGIGAGLPIDREDDAALILEPRGELVVFHAVDDTAELAQADRCAVAVGDDDGPEGGSIIKLARRLYGKHAVLAVECASRSEEHTSELQSR